MIIWKNNTRNCYECGIKSEFLEKKYREDLEFQFMLVGNGRSGKALKMVNDLNGKPSRKYIRY